MTTVTGAQAGPIRTRAEQLQFLRFLAFFNIYVVHTEDWVFFPYPSAHCSDAAVSFFFILSGLVVGLSSFGKEQSLRLDTWGGYVWKRIRKIYPLYLVTTLLSVLYSAIPKLIAAQDFVGLKEPLTHLAKHLLLIQAWFPNDGFHYNGAGWYLSSLMFLTALTPVLCVLLNKLRKYRFGPLLMLAGSVGVAGVIVVYCYTTQTLPMDYWHYQFPPARLAEYLIGMIWGFLVCEGKLRIQTQKWWKWLFTVLEIFVLVFWVYSLSRPGNYWRNHIISWLKPNCLLLIVFTLGYGWLSELLRWKPLVRLGDLSFGCYLIHGIVVKIYRAVNGYSLPNVESRAFAFLFCLGVSILLAHMMDRPKTAK